MEISLENLYVVEGSQKRSNICGLFRFRNLLGAKRENLGTNLPCSLEPS